MQAQTERASPAQPRVLLLVHGVMSEHSLYASLAQGAINRATDATGQPWQAVVVDQRCHGGSLGLPGLEAPHSVDASAADLLRLLSWGLRQGRCGGAARLAAQQHVAQCACRQAHTAQRRHQSRGAGWGGGRSAQAAPPEATPLPPAALLLCRWGRPEVLVGHSLGGLVVLQVGGAGELWPCTAQRASLRDSAAALMAVSSAARQPASIRWSCRGTVSGGNAARQPEYGSLVLAAGRHPCMQMAHQLWLAAEKGEPAELAELGAPKQASSP